MKILDCDVRWPGFGKITIMVALAVGLWSLQFVMGLGKTNAFDAGASLTAMIFGCVINSVGISVANGWKPVLVTIVGCALVMMVYRLVFSFLAG